MIIRNNNLFTSIYDQYGKEGLEGGPAPTSSSSFGGFGDPFGDDFFGGGDEPADGADEIEGPGDEPPGGGPCCLQ